MPLTSGTQLGPYTLTALIGKGGMGEVYRARDPRLNRDVAIKVSAAQFTERFRREAEAVASLNHPHICTLYDVGPNYLVMEYIEGPTLGERIKAGAIPLEAALALAKQMASALEHAHDKGVIHRDLKPANVKLKADGSEYGFVKVLDFGLAKMGSAPQTHTGEDSPTLTIGMTEVGVILGTAGYMAPEQAKGKVVDKRADIFSFGVVVHEMLTARRMFSGETVSDTLAQVILKDPEWDGVPKRAQRVLKWCLEKDPAKRLRDIGDVQRLLDEEEPVAVAERLSAPSQSRLGTISAWTLAGLMALAAAGVSYLHFREAPPDTAVRSVTLLPPDGTVFDAAGPVYAIPAISPDGKRLVFGAKAADGKGQTQLWLRPMDSAIAQPLPGTEGGTLPFWSPDSRWVAFGSPDNKLKKIDVQGGPPLTLTALNGAFRGGSWSPEGVIVYASQTAEPFFKVSAAGGSATPASKLEPEQTTGGHRFPWFLPDGKHFLYISAKNEGANLVQAGSMDEPGKVGKVVAQADSNAVFASGRLLYLRGDTLMAQPFDTVALATTGEAAPLAERITSTGMQPSRPGIVTASNELLIFSSGVKSSAANTRLTWLDRSGKQLSTVGDPETGFADIQLSPDQKSLAGAILDGTPKDLWIWELARGLKTRFTFTGINFDSLWSPDGTQVVFRAQRDKRALYRKAANGSGVEELLYDGDAYSAPGSWSPDGKELLISTRSGNSGIDLSVLALTPEPRKPRPFLAESYSEIQGKYSPDGKWGPTRPTIRARTRFSSHRIQGPAGRSKFPSPEALGRAGGATAKSCSTFP